MKMAILKMAYRNFEIVFVKFEKLDILHLLFYANVWVWEKINVGVHVLNVSKRRHPDYTGLTVDN